MTVYPDALTLPLDPDLAGDTLASAQHRVLHYDASTSIIGLYDAIGHVNPTGYGGLPVFFGPEQSDWGDGGAIRIVDWSPGGVGTFNETVASSSDQVSLIGTALRQHGGGTINDTDYYHISYSDDYTKFVQAEILTAAVAEGSYTNGYIQLANENGSMFRAGYDGANATLTMVAQSGQTGEVVSVVDDDANKLLQIKPPGEGVGFWVVEGPSGEEWINMVTANPSGFGLGLLELSAHGIGDYQGAVQIQAFAGPDTATSTGGVVSVLAGASDVDSGNVSIQALAGTTGLGGYISIRSWDSGNSEGHIDILAGGHIKLGSLPIIDCYTGGSALGFFAKTPVPQGGHITPPSGGATVDSQARTAISSILSQLEAYGLLHT